MTTGAKSVADPRSITQKGKKPRSSPGSYIRISVAAASPMRDADGWLHAGVSEFHQYPVRRLLSPCAVLEQTSSCSCGPSVSVGHPKTKRSPYAFLLAGGRHTSSMIYLRPLPLMCVTPTLCNSEKQHLFFLFGAFFRCVSRCEHDLPSKT